MSVQLVSKISNLCDPDPPTLQTDRQTDGRHAISIPRYALVHRAVKRWLRVVADDSLRVLAGNDGMHVPIAYCGRCYITRALESNSARPLANFPADEDA